jgi:hypothetical protein
MSSTSTTPHLMPVATQIPATYQASPIERLRAIKAAVEMRRSALLDIVADMQPMTMRQVFYQATVRGIVEKTEAGYAKVQTDLVLMRRFGELPYGWLADNTRVQRKPRTFDGVKDALERTAKFYPKTYGPRRTATSRSGWRRTRCRASSIRSPPPTTCG